MGKVYAKYHHQRRTALKRNIDWCFSYPQWVRWWEKQLGKNWFVKRGAGPDQYCMARFNDVGPYQEDNVKCVLWSENRKEQTGPAPIGETNRLSKLSDAQRLYIRNSDEHWSTLAAKFHVHRTTIQRVQRKKSS
jgi:hypothetical protein